MTFLVFASAAIASFILFRLTEILDGESAPHLLPDSLKPFKQKWPAISDDEFVNRCPPGTRRETALKVRKVVAEQLGIPYDHVYPEQNFVNDLGCD